MSRQNFKFSANCTHTYHKIHALRHLLEHWPQSPDVYYMLWHCVYCILIPFSSSTTNTGSLVTLVYLVLGLCVKCFQPWFYVYVCLLCVSAVLAFIRNRRIRGQRILETRHPAFIRHRYQNPWHFLEISIY